MDIPKNLVEQISHGNCIVFVGARLSEAAGLPDWPSRLHKMLDWGQEHGVNLTERKELESCIKKGRLSLAVDEIRDQFGKDKTQEFIEEAFDSTNLKPAYIHELLARIPFAAAINFNYDTLLELAYQRHQNAKQLLALTPYDHDELLALFRSCSFYILNLYGTVGRSETIIFGRKDYREVMHSKPSFRQYLEVLLSSKTLVFIGSEFNDPDLTLFLNECLLDLGEFSQQKYALMNVQSIPYIRQQYFEENYRIQIIPYKPSGPEHPEILEFLAKLADNLGQAEKPTEEKPSEVLLGRPSNVPELPTYFLSRPDHLETIKGFIMRDIGKPVAITGTNRIGLYGMSGIGKSVLAAALARDDQVLAAFPDGVAWLNIGQEPDILARQRMILTLFSFTFP